MAAGASSLTPPKMEGSALVLAVRIRKGKVVHQYLNGHAKPEVQWFARVRESELEASKPIWFYNKAFCLEPVLQRRLIAVFEACRIN